MEPSAATAAAVRMEQTSNVDVQGDIPRNVIRVRYHGHVSVPEVRAVSEKVLALLPLLRPGFTFLGDLSGLELMELDCVPEITRIMDACRAAGIGTVVRVVPDPKKDIGFNILSIVHYRGGVRVITCQTAEEAERLL
jgi:hypothetical protein